MFSVKTYSHVPIRVAAMASRSCSLSTSVAGVATLNGGSGLITPTGTIAGAATGVVVTGLASSLTNQGLVNETGTGGDGVSFASAGTIINAASGSIAGGGAGILLNAGGSVTQVTHVTTQLSPCTSWPARATNEGRKSR